MLLSILLAQAAAVPPAPPAPPPSVLVRPGDRVLLVDAPVAGVPAARMRLERVAGAPLLTVTGIGDPWSLRVVAIRDVLGLLADRRAAPLWPALIAEFGDDLVRLRDRRIGEARQIVEMGGTRMATTPAASSVRPRLRAILLLVDELRAGGQVAEAAELLRAARGPAPAPGSWGEAEWSSASLRLATILIEADDIDGALALLRTSEDALPPGSDYRLNFAMTRAAILANRGAGAEALALVDRARAAFDAQQSRRAAEKVPGSTRHFDWVRACALTRLGRRAEAAPLIAGLTRGEEPTDPDFVLQTNREVLYRLADCIQDSGLSARVMADEARSVPLGGAPFTLLQPAQGGRYAPAMRAAIARDAALADLIRTRLRVLPPELEPALNAWSPPTRPRVAPLAATP